MEREMDAIKASYLPFVFLISLTIFTKPGISNHTPSPHNGTDLITWVCNYTQFFNICMSSLQSYPNSHNTDLRGLAFISVDIAFNHANETLAYIENLNATSSVDGNYTSKCLRDCLEEYGEALDDLDQSIMALHQRSYHTVNSMVSGAMTNGGTCESGCNDKPKFRSPPMLTQRNDHFSMLCSNSLAITKLLD